MENILYQFGYETTELSTKRINFLSTKRPRWVRKGCGYDTTGGWIIVGSPDSITHPKSLITWGCGFSCFIVSSSFMRSLLSDSEALAEINQTGSKKLIYLHCSFPKCKCNLKAHGVKVIPKRGKLQLGDGRMKRTPRYVLYEIKRKRSESISTN